MKEFRKTKDGLFICEECGKEFKYKKTLSYHINKLHNCEDYADMWLKDEKDLCIICKKETKFINFKKGYKNCCSKECRNILREKTCMEIYGVKYASQSEKAKETAKQTFQEKYNVDNPWQAKEIKEKIKQICFKKYGVEYSLQSEEVKNKSKQTNLKKYGVEYSLQNTEIKEKGNQTKLEKYGDENFTNRKKSKQTCLKKYGVENPVQNPEIFEKIFKTRIKLHHYLDTNLTYQGSYELDFLEKYYNKIDIENSPSIKYIYNNKNKVYHPDFYIPLLNLIVEIKNSYLFKRDKKEIKVKKTGALNKGYNYIIIVNKDYSKFNKLFSNSIPYSS